MSETEQIKTVRKLHRQFRHQSEKVTEDMMRRAEVLTLELKRINQNVVKDCEICNRYKRTRPRPIVSLPLARRFNEVIAMDLKVVKNGSLYFINFIDFFIRFSRAQVIHRKTPETVVNALITTWMPNGLGTPGKVLVDNGGEFDNPLYFEAMEQYNIEVCANGFSSPWSNGTCDRNHAVIDLLVDKMLEEDPKMKIEFALANDISAKNSMQNHFCFTPIKLVAGILPNIPSVLNSDLPELEEAY